MARIAGVNIPTNKRLVVALTYIHGIGRKRSETICSMTRLEESKRVKDLAESEVLSIRECIEKEFRVEGDLRSEVSRHVKRLMDLKTYRGLRHRNRLPCHGQRTRSNARTRKGKSKGPIAKSKA